MVLRATALVTRMRRACLVLALVTSAGLACATSSAAPASSAAQDSFFTLEGAEDRIRVHSLTSQPENAETRVKKSVRGQPPIVHVTLGGGVGVDFTWNPRLRAAVATGGEGAPPTLNDVPDRWWSQLGQWNGSAMVVGATEVCWLGGAVDAGKERLLRGGLCFDQHGSWSAVDGDVLGFNVNTGRGFFLCEQSVGTPESALFVCTLPARKDGETDHSGHPVEVASPRYVEVRGVR